MECDGGGGHQHRRFLQAVGISRHGLPPEKFGLESPCRGQASWLRCGSRLPLIARNEDRRPGLPRGDARRVCACVLRGAGCSQAGGRSARPAPALFARRSTTLHLRRWRSFLAERAAAARRMRLAVARQTAAMCGGWASWGPGDGGRRPAAGPVTRSGRAFDDASPPTAVPFSSRDFSNRDLPTAISPTASSNSILQQHPPMLARALE